MQKPSSDVITTVLMYLLYSGKQVSIADLVEHLKGMEYKILNKEADKIVCEFFEYVGGQGYTFAYDGVPCFLAYYIDKTTRIYGLIEADGCEEGEPETTPLAGESCGCSDCGCEKEGKTVKIKKEKLTDKEKIRLIIQKHLDKGITDMHTISQALGKKGFEVSPRSVAAIKANITMGH